MMSVEHSALPVRFFLSGVAGALPGSIPLFSFILAILFIPGERMDKVKFAIGCEVSLFKYTESEVWAQYKKLEHKVEAGASYTILLRSIFKGVCD